jgi:uncharacterized metal-binding protein
VKLKILKLANQLLKVKRKAKQEARSAKRNAKASNDFSATIEISRNGSTSAMQKIQLETQAKMQYRQADVAFEIEKQKAEAQLKAQLMQQEFNYNAIARV